MKLPVEVALPGSILAMSGVAAWEKAKRPRQRFNTHPNPDAIFGGNCLARRRDRHGMRVEGRSSHPRLKEENRGLRRRGRADQNLNQPRFFL